ncbi:MAG TPA: helicase C-terminal domain-containing protein [Micromonosporaceae bacterium]|nr:helicase C-terminal domain-containing protein [Micromonosporaceae bacterium]
MTSTLVRWLAERSRDELAAILARRPETLGARHLGDVAIRLGAPYGIETALRGLPQPCVELLETVVVYGTAGIEVDDLASVLGVDVDDGLFRAALAVCEWWALAWVVDDDVYVAPALATALPRPLHLGPRIADLLAPRTLDDLRTRASVLGISPTARKHELVAAIADFYRDGDAVRALVDAAPSAQRERLTEAAWHGPVLDHDGPFLYSARPDPSIAWLLAHGLVIADWQQIVVPREVALAVRGEDWHPTLTPRPEVATKAGASAAVVDRDAAAAAAVAAEHVALVLDECEMAAPVLLKTGGIGVREIRRIGKSTGLTEPAVRMWLTLAADVGLVETDGDVLLPTAAYDEWLAESPAGRLATLIDAWWDLRTVPTLVDRPDDSVPRPALADDAYASAAAELRGDLLTTATEIPAGRSVTDAKALAASVAWRRPTSAQRLADPTYAVESLWAEAHLLGVAARGALSSLGRAVLGELAADADPSRSPAPRGASGPAIHQPGLIGEPVPPIASRRRADERDRLARLVAVAERLLPEHTRDAIFQADLTVVVTGTPAADLAALLDGAADRESRGGATTWRFSAASVRRALDAGHTGDSLTDALRAVAARRTQDGAANRALPQPLEYLIADTARRHGGIRVRAVGCVLRADDEALLTELIAAKSLARLALFAVAPNVLGSALNAAETLSALRSAGYAPIGEGSDGLPLVERVAKRRASRLATVIPIQSRRSGVPASDPYERADELLSEPLPEPEPTRPGLHLVAGASVTSTSVLVERYASRLSDGERDVLSDAIDAAQPVRIAYTSGSGEISDRVIEPIELSGGMLVAWCRLRGDERKFALGRIDSVTAASR